MKRKEYFPNRMSDQAAWLGNLADKLPDHATELDLSSATVTAAVADARWGSYVLGSWLADVRSFAPATTAAVKEALFGAGAGTIAMPVFTAPPLPAGVSAQPPGLLDRLFGLIAQFKMAAGYTEAIGVDLGVIGSAETEKPAPRVTGEAETGVAGQVATLRFVKYRHNGVYIESRRGGSAWAFLAIDTESPYADDRPLAVAGQPEVREYRLRFWDKGTPNGDWTDPVQVTVGP